MLHTNRYKLIELFTLFVLAPVSFFLDIPIEFKLAFGLLGFTYIVFIIMRIEKINISIITSLNWRVFWKHTLFKLMVIAVLTALYVYIVDRENLFTMPLNKTKVWIFILFFYSLFSVYPQELIYRTFFFQRYQPLFKNETFFIFFNAVLFSLAHLFFNNALVLLFTFIGGLLFALTYKKTQSILVVSIEHAIYGCWLFSVGMGAMLGFPS